MFGYCAHRSSRIMGSIISVCATKSADKVLKIPSDLAPGLTAFYHVAGPAGKLQRHELESLLKAIGMRKSVLALALDKLDAPKPHKEDDVELLPWWNDLNPRSRIVIESKLRTLGDHQSTVLRLGCTVAQTAGKRKVCASKVELRGALSHLGLEDDQLLDAMLAACEDNVKLDKWFATLSGDHASKVRAQVWGDSEDPVAATPASPVAERNTKTILPGAEPTAA